MIVTKVTEQFPLYLPAPKVPRSGGVHVSSVIRCIATEVGILKPEWCEELSLVDARVITDPVAILRINIGLAWEEHYIPMLTDVVDHPDELERDGIYLSRDGESLSSVFAGRKDTLFHIVHEVKSTYKSSNTVKDLSGELMWLMQLKSYCKASDTRFSRMHVLFMCGDYKFPIKPALEIWDIEFTQQELDNNWGLITGYRDERLIIECNDYTKNEG